MIELEKAIQGSYWWEKEGKILIDPDSVGSVEQVYERTQGGSRSPAYVRLATKDGATHNIYGDIEDVARKLGFIK